MNKEKQPKPNYNFDIQKLYLEMFLSDAETFVRCQNIFDPLNFDQRLQNIATFINKYVDEYKVMPEANIVNASTGSDLNPPYNFLSMLGHPVLICPLPSLSLVRRALL